MKNPKKMSDDELRAFKAAMEHIYGLRGAKPLDPDEFLNQKKHSARTSIDDDGQPVNRRFREKDVGVRQVDELIGLLKGILSDQSLVDAEVRFLEDWLDSNAFASTDWPGSVLQERIRRALEDDVLDADEIGEIREIISSIVNGGKHNGSGQDLTTDLPLDKPIPTIEFSGKKFCFTGKLLWGSRRDAELAVLNRGGKIVKPSKTLEYLVLGRISSRDWKHSTHGLKILNAVDLKENGIHIGIISEENWAAALKRFPETAPEMLP